LLSGCLQTGEPQCTTLRIHFPSQTFTNNCPYFDLGQFSVTPALRIEPSSASEVSTILKILVEGNVPFAVKNGGHGSAIGSSNDDDGVTIDSARLNGVQLLKDQKTVRIGAGER
jgi:FAD/FMN-containing dehydrogenase